MHRELSSPIIPQQNGIVKKKNRAIKEMNQTMLNSKKVALYF